MKRAKRVTRLTRAGLVSLTVLVTSTGCFSTPTPLAPGLHGSVGVPNRGVLTEAEELPVRGAGFVRYRPQGTHYFARPRLVHALQAAAATVLQQAPGGAPLYIGDLSAKTGGRIPGHDSHRSGRDVDLLFLVTTPSGAPVRSPGFVKFEGDGLASAAVKAEIVEHLRGPKLRVFKFKPKRGYKRRTGHRQELTRLKITKLGA